jgi:CBS domain-containing protein
MELKDIMVKNVITVNPNATVKHAAKLMNQHNIGCLIVVGKGKVVGIVTERDILRKIVESSKDPEKTKVSEIMSTKLLVAAPNMDIVDAAKMMLQRKIKKLPIVTNKKLVGLVSLTDIVRTVRIEPEIMNVIKDLTKSGWLPPKSMKNIVEFYTD